MTTHELVKTLALTVFNQGEDRPVACGYTGDLLSWVMGRAPDDCAWVTVMNNTNVAAVAVLRDVACIILAEGAEPDSQFLSRAVSEGLCVYGSAEDAFSLCVALSKLL